jgi:Transposase zinc-binding domain
VVGRSERAPEPKLEVAEILRRHGKAWRLANASHINVIQRRVMTAIEICRTAELGGHVERCEDCAHTRVAYNSCRNRHCGKCQWSATAAWLAAREAELLPVPYFHVVFTLPAVIGAIAYQNKAKVYGLLFKAAAEALLTIAAERRRRSADIGITAVLHTWGQKLDHHRTYIASFPAVAFRRMASAGFPVSRSCFDPTGSRSVSDGCSSNI